MGQYWQLIALDRRMTTVIGYGRKLGEMFYGDHENLLELLCWPIPRIDAIMIDIEKWSIVKPYKDSSQYSKSKFESLPFDIHLAIFKLCSVKDLISLVISSWTFWNAGKRYLPRALAFEPAWAQSRLICVGDYIHVDDHPSGMLTENELAEVTAAGTLYGFADRFKSVRRYNALLYETTFLGRSQDDRIFRKLAEDRFPERNRVVRNISKREVIRESGLEASTRIGRFGLSHALLSRICWSSDPSTAMRYEGDIHRGQWAGDRIDILCEDRFNEEGPLSQDYKDVTDESIQLLADIWAGDRAC